MLRVRGVIMKERNKISETLKCCYGISSSAGLDEHVFVTDIDGYSKESVIGYLLYLQHGDLDLSDIYVIKTEHGYNAISCDIMPLKRIYEIGNEVLSIADREFFKYGYKRGYYTIRFGADKELTMILPNKSNRYVKSNAHANFLEWFFHIKIPRDERFNCMKTIKVIQYTSEKNGHHFRTFTSERKGLVTSS